MLDTTDDHLIIDGLESITLKEKTSTHRNALTAVMTDTTAQTAVNNCLRREITEREAIDSGGRLLSNDVFWIIYFRELPNDFTIEKDMTIIPDAALTECWKILAVDKSLCTMSFRCQSRK